MLGVREAFKKQISQIMEKVHNFLDPPLRMFLTPSLIHQVYIIEYLGGVVYFILEVIPYLSGLVAGWVE